MLRRILEDPLSATGGVGGGGVGGWMALWALENEIEKILRRILPSKQNKTMLSTPSSSEEHKENGAHQMWNKNDAFNSTQV
jgi:hypothetical protein